LPLCGKFTENLNGRNVAEFDPYLEYLKIIDGADTISDRRPGEACGRNGDEGRGPASPPAAGPAPAVFAKA
jgi:hypothetical protein